MLLLGIVIRGNKLCPDTEFVLSKSMDRIVSVTALCKHSTMPAHEPHPSQLLGIHTVNVRTEMHEFFTGDYYKGSFNEEPQVCEPHERARNHTEG